MQLSDTHTLARGIKARRCRTLCEIKGCTRQNRRPSKLCVRHGGGKRCAEVECNIGAVYPTERCIAHGGGRRCVIPDCENSAQGVGSWCKKHGGGKRRRTSPCTTTPKGAFPRRGLCKNRVGEHHGSNAKSQILPPTQRLWRKPPSDTVFPDETQQVWSTTLAHQLLQDFDGSPHQICQEMFTVNLAGGDIHQGASPVSVHERHVSVKPSHDVMGGDRSLAALDTFVFDENFDLLL